MPDAIEISQPFRDRLNTLLRGPEVGLPFLVRYYGIQLPDDSFLGMFRAWNAAFSPQRNFFSHDFFDRYALEKFFQYQKMMPMKWAAAALGMDTDSLLSTLNEMSNQGLITLNDFRAGDQFVREELIRTFYRRIPNLNATFFENHDDYCRQLHRSISQLLHFEIRPLYCLTSIALQEQNLKFAQAFDILTDQPVSIQNEVWLNFNKPISLRPDITSQLSYVRHSATIGRCLFGAVRMVNNNQREKLLAYQ